MTTAAAFRAFWGRSNWRDTFGKVRIVNGSISRHSGLDLGVRARDPIYALEGGVVETVGYRADIGWYVEVRVTATRYDTYCHVLPDVAVGQRVGRGQTIGRAAGHDDDHGTMWTGPHLHFMTAATFNAAGVRSRAVNPEGVVGAALTQLAQIAESAVITDPPTFRRRRSMATLYATTFTDKVPMPQRVHDQAARCGTPITNPRGVVFALMGDSPGTPANVIVTQENTFGNLLAADHSGAIPALGIEQGARRLSPDVFLRFFDAYLTPLGATGGVSGVTPADLAGVEKRIIEAIPTKATLS